MTDQRAAEDAIARARDRFGPIDVLINDAGVIQAGPLENQQLADFEEAMRVHFWAPLYTMQAVLPEMRARHAGRIVNISIHRRQDRRAAPRALLCQQVRPHRPV